MSFHFPDDLKSICCRPLLITESDCQNADGVATLNQNPPHVGQAPVGHLWRLWELHFRRTHTHTWGSSPSFNPLVITSANPRHLGSPPPPPQPDSPISVEQSNAVSPALRQAHQASPPVAISTAITMGTAALWERATS